MDKLSGMLHYRGGPLDAFLICFGSASTVYFTIRSAWHTGWRLRGPRAHEPYFGIIGILIEPEVRFWSLLAILCGRYLFYPSDNSAR